MSQAHDTDPIARMSSRILQVRPDYDAALESALAFRRQGILLGPPQRQADQRAAASLKLRS
jgi:hypothetical protein